MSPAASRSFASRPTLLAALCATAFGLAPVAWAQTAPPPAVLPRAEPALPPVAPARPLDLRTPDRPPLPASEGLQVQVDRFVVTGATRLSATELDAALAPYSGRRLGYAQLQEAANALTDAYRRRGFLLALAYLPQQAVADGAVEIAVLEGQLGKLNISTAAGADAAFAEAVANWRLAPGAVVSEANLVRNLIVLNELPGLAVAARVQPGAAVGTADVFVDVRSSGPSWAGAAVVDNFGTPYTGRLRLGAAATGNNLLGRGDQLSLRGLVTQNGGLQSGAASWAVPVHASGTRAGIGFSTLRYRLGAPYAALDANGTASVLSALAEQPLVRSFGYTLDGRAVLAHKWLRDRIDLFGSRNDRQIDSLQLGLTGEARDGVFGGGRTFWNASFTTGRVRFDDAAAATADAAQLRTAGRFNKVNLELGRQQLLAPRLSVTVRGLMQAADRNLDSSERVTFNGANALRPFGALPTAADEALQFAADARWLPPQNLVAGMALVAFADAGTGRSSRNPLPVGNGGGENRFHSLLAGVGAELPLPGSFSLRLAASREHVTVRGAGDKGWATRGWFELARSF